MKTKLLYELIVIGALLTFIGFLAVLVAAYVFLGATAALVSLIGLVGVGAAGLLVAGDPAEAEAIDAYAAPEGAPRFRSVAERQETVDFVTLAQRSGPGGFRRVRD